ncbi:MAG: ferrous iron transport protein A [Actinobacteria bacterium HGW-Actinobacteria-10]|jgi:Fe2+ transport system protein FeoA|nr:MAG: ferrous iron transport protein A [Actinobacteria bacterium HGW-Actinobacteria-10]
MKLGFGKWTRKGNAAGIESTLDAVRGGDRFEVIEINDDHARMSALRFGMAEGSCASCVTTIPAGPVVVCSGRQEIAIGRKLARRIRVRHGSPDTTRRAG